MLSLITRQDGPQNVAGSGNIHDKNKTAHHRGIVAKLWQQRCFASLTRNPMATTLALLLLAQTTIAKAMQPSGKRKRCNEWSKAENTAGGCDLLEKTKQMFSTMTYVSELMGTRDNGTYHAQTSKEAVLKY